jgi:hypothetical protein
MYFILLWFLDINNIIHEFFIIFLIDIFNLYIYFLINYN